MRMAFLVASIGLGAVGTPGRALDLADKVTAVLSEDSGSVAPEYAWEYWVRFHESGMVEVEYCKGYAETAPGCATVRKKLDNTARTAMEAEMAPYSDGLVVNRPRQAADDQIPIGGGSIGGWVQIGDKKIVLPDFPVAEDVPRVSEVLGILQKYTPKNLVKKASRRARQP